MASDMAAVPNPNTHTNQIKLAQIIERSESERLQRVEDVEQPPADQIHAGAGNVEGHKNGQEAVGPSGNYPVIKPGRRQ